MFAALRFLAICALLVPLVMWLGWRWAQLIDRLARPARDRVIESTLNDDRAEPPSVQARIANVAVIHDEMLVELVPAEAQDLLAHWLNGPADVDAVRAAERCFRRGSLVNVQDRGQRHVLLEVDGRAMDLVRLRDLIEPSI